MISSLPTTVSAMRSNVDLKTTVGLCIASVVFLAIVARQMVLRKNSQKYQGSVADLVRRGQLRSDRRSVSKPLKYEDPFNNPLVKAGKSDSTIEMCGKVYRLAPVTLTKEEQSVHQKRRSRAYQWKRPTTFLKEGDSVPPDVDPDTVKWIPANHPFATTVSDIDENLARNNVNQKHGVPFRIKAEHEEMQKRLEALQNGQKMNEIEIDSSLISDFERPFKPSSKELESSESSSTTNKKFARTPSLDQNVGSSDNQKLRDEPKQL